MRVHEYKVVEGQYLPDFVRRVNDEISDGWQPFGSVSTAVWPGRDGMAIYEPPTTWYAQAMVRYLE